MTCPHCNGFIAEHDGELKCWMCSRLLIPIVPLPYSPERARYMYEPHRRGKLPAPPRGSFTSGKMTRWSRYREAP